jgi:hypothetical protein
MNWVPLHRKRVRVWRVSVGAYNRFSNVVGRPKKQKPNAAFPFAGIAEEFVSGRDQNLATANMRTQRLGTPLNSKP